MASARKGLFGATARNGKRGSADVILKAGDNPEARAEKKNKAQTDIAVIQDRLRVHACNGGSWRGG
jgi:hypothetical protein